MSTKPKIVAVSGGLYKPSRTRVLVDEIVNGLVHHQPADVRIIDLSAIAAELGAVVTPTDLPRHILDDIHAIEQADLLVVASPVYRASFTGLFKHLFDFVHHEALIDVPVLLAATGGSERHALVIDHQLRPLFSFFQAHTLPIGVYGSEADFHNYRVTSESLQARIDLAVTRALPFLKKRRQPQPDLAAA